MKIATLKDIYMYLIFSECLPFHFISSSHFAGLLTQLPQDFFTFLQEVQNKLAKVIKSVGKIEHSLYPLRMVIHATL